MDLRLTGSIGETFYFFTWLPLHPRCGDVSSAYDTIRANGLDELAT